MTFAEVAAAVAQERSYQRNRWGANKEQGRSFRAALRRALTLLGE